MRLNLIETKLGATYATEQGLAYLSQNGVAKKLRTCELLSERLERDGDFLTDGRGNRLAQLPTIADRTTFLGEGSEGYVYSLSAQHAVKIFHFFGGSDRTAFLAYERLAQGSQQTLYDVPQLFLATRRILVAENVSKYPDFFSFIREHPGEKNKLYAHICDLASKGPVRFDHGDICAMLDVGDMGEVEKSSVFVKDFNPKKTDLAERYRLIVTDFT